MLGEKSGLIFALLHNSNVKSAKPCLDKAKIKDRISHLAAEMK